MCPNTTTSLSKTNSVPWKRTYDSNKIVQPFKIKSTPWKSTKEASKVKVGQPFNTKSTPWKSTKEAKKLKFVGIGKKPRQKSENMIHSMDPMCRGPFNRHLAEVGVTPYNNPLCEKIIKKKTVYQ